MRDIPEGKKYETEVRTASEWKARSVCVGSIKEHTRFLAEIEGTSLKGKSTSLDLGKWLWGKWTMLVERPSLWPEKDD